MKLLTEEISVLRRQVEEDKDEVEELKDRVGNFKVQMQGREVSSWTRPLTVILCVRVCEHLEAQEVIVSSLYVNCNYVQ